MNKQVEQFYYEFMDADIAWQEALVSHFGEDRAQSERYMFDNSHHPAYIRHLKTEFITASDKYHNARIAAWNEKYGK